MLQVVTPQLCEDKQSALPHSSGRFACLSRLAPSVVFPLGQGHDIQSLLPCRDTIALDVVDHITAVKPHLFLESFLLSITQLCCSSSMHWPASISLHQPASGPLQSDQSYTPAVACSVWPLPFTNFDVTPRDEGHGTITFTFRNLCASSPPTTPDCLHSLRFSPCLTSRHHGFASSPLPSAF